MTQTAFAFGLGVGTLNAKNEWLEVFFPQPILNPSPDIVALASGSDSNGVLTQEQLRQLQKDLSTAGEAELAAFAGRLGDSSRPAVMVLLEQDNAPANVPEGYLKLHLLSHRLVKPHGTDLTGLFGVLPNVAWTNEGPVDIAELAERQLAARLRGDVLEVSCCLLYTSDAADD